MGDFTPGSLQYVSTHQSFKIDRAKKDFGYSPIVSFEKGIEISKEFLREQIQILRKEKKKTNYNFNYILPLVSLLVWYVF